jgi:hypothetical protein
MKKTITRKYLVTSLKNLLTDEFDANELVYMTDDELVIHLVYVAEYYQREYNDSHK